MRWVSVYNELPKEGQEVLFVDADGIKHVGWFDGVSFCADCEGKEITCCYDETDDVPYWAPIPPVPTDMEVLAHLMADIIMNRKD